MAKFEKCDNCEKVSPDKNDLHIANSWYEVAYVNRRELNRYTDNRRQLLLCEECFEKTGIEELKWEYLK